jgi:hypothetical protein
LFDRSQATLIQYPPARRGGSYAIPSSVTSIGDFAFEFCNGLATVTIGANVTSIGSLAFGSCGSLRGVYFQGNTLPALVFDTDVFLYDNNATVYYLPEPLAGVRGLLVVQLRNCRRHSPT